MSIVDPEPGPNPPPLPAIPPAALDYEPLPPTEPREPIGRLALVTVLGVVIWIGTQAAYMIAVLPDSVRSKGKVTADVFSAGDFAFLSIVPPALALAALILGDNVAKLKDRIGYARSQLLPGVLIAIPLSVVIIVLMLVASIGLEWVYQAIGFKHPSEHDLLGAMKKAPAWVTVFLLIGACVAAPVFEEMLFRGHIQTLATWFFHRRIDPARAARARWMAIILTSLLFTAMHPLWTAPLIFALSLCLGAAYAWTRNLWTAMLIHAAFNTFNTLVFLNYR